MNERSPRWPWALFVIAAVYCVLIRVPLVLNAATHLDSDLAVDGLTLLDATRGQWRWHYPGTPFIGSGPVLLSLPQALIWGTGPETLVSGGPLAWVGLLLATFLLAWQAFGPGAAAWSLVPLTFASTGAIWLSGRITGGHLTAAAWHAGAFALLAACLNRKEGFKLTGFLGFWCGLGLALDSMLAVTLAGLVTAAVGFWVAQGMDRRAWLAAALFLLGFLAGTWPRYAGAWLDPYDAYGEQFSSVSEPRLLASHARILVLDCLPRLIAGHRLPGLESDPDPASISASGAPRRRSTFDPLSALVVGLTLSLAALAVVFLTRALVQGPSATSRTVAWGLVLSTSATLVGFIINRNIYNSDNYRYLVCLLVPWALGFGILMDAVVSKGRRGTIIAAGCSLLLAIVMTADQARWYARFGWVDDRGMPVRRPLDDPTLGWLEAHPDVTWIEGGYWDVYRLSFLTGGRARGVPFPIYPNRFPEWRPARGGRQATIVRGTAEGRSFREAAIRAGRRPVQQARGVTILASP